MIRTDAARAKVNLSLHVTGRRPDGYHLLDSLVVFADIADRLRMAPAPAPSLSLSGRFAGDVPTGPDNLVLRAAAALAPDRPMAFDLEKVLPVAAGLGGGSADAAAALRLLSAATGRAVPDALALGLGADVPVCLASAPCRMGGIGEVLQPVPALPRLGVVLVNPGVPVATARVFQGLATVENPPMAIPDRFDDGRDFAHWLGSTRNDLQVAAIAVAPAIAEVLTALGAVPGCQMARMSGSGATCVGLFPDAATARAAAAMLRPRAPTWWVATGNIGG